MILHIMQAVTHDKNEETRLIRMGKNKFFVLALAK